MQLVDVDAICSLVRVTGIERILQELATYIEADLRRWPSFEKTPRLASHSATGVIELMPTCDGVDYTFKYVNGHPGNVAAGLQTVTSFGILASVRTGYPELLAEMTIATALRTAATSGLAARYLARKDARTMAIIGLGAQSEFQAYGFRALMGIRRLQVFDIDSAATAKFMANMAGTGIHITVCTTAQHAVLGADIVTTVTADKAHNRVLSDNMIGAGVHINAVGGDCPGKTELDANILHRAKIFVEYAPQTRMEGEVQQLANDHPVVELWQVVNGEVAGRADASQITIFDSVGFAVEDFSTLRYLRDKLSGAPHQRSIDLLALPRDPRNLFGLVRVPQGEGASSERELCDKDFPQRWNAISESKVKNS